MIHGSSCEANLPIIAALPEPIAADLELNYHGKMYWAASSPKSGCVSSTINHYWRRLIPKKNCRQIIRTGKDVQLYGQGHLSCISQSACTTINISLQTQHIVQVPSPDNCEKRLLTTPRLPVSVSPAMEQIGYH